MSRFTRIQTFAKQIGALPLLGAQRTDSSITPNPRPQRHLLQQEFKDMLPRVFLPLVTHRRSLLFLLLLSKREERIREWWQSFVVSFTLRSDAYSKTIRQAVSQSVPQQLMDKYAVLNELFVKDQGRQTLTLMPMPLPEYGIDLSGRDLGVPTHEVVKDRQRPATRFFYLPFSPMIILGIFFAILGLAKFEKTPLIIGAALIVFGVVGCLALELKKRRQSRRLMSNYQRRLNHEEHEALIQSAAHWYGQFEAAEESLPQHAARNRLLMIMRSMLQITHAETRRERRVLKPKLAKMITWLNSHSPVEQTERSLQKDGVEVVIDDVADSGHEDGHNPSRGCGKDEETDDESHEEDLVLRR